MDKDFRKAIAESFTEPHAKRKEEFFNSIEETKRRVIPFYGRVIAAAACCIFAIGIGFSIKNISKHDISGEHYSVTDPTEPVTVSADTKAVSKNTTAYRTEKNTISITTAVVSSVSENIGSAMSKNVSASTGNASSANLSTKSDYKTALTISSDTAQTSLRTWYTQTTVPAVTVQVSFTTAAESTEIESERSFIMKKLTAFLAAISIGAVYVPDAYAITEEYFHGMKTFGYNEEFYNTYEYHIEALNAFDAPSFDKDINDDGVFDIIDCYALFTYYNYEDIIMNSQCQSGAYKFTKDLPAVYTPPVEDFDVSGLFMDYFVRTNDMKKEYLDPSYYMENVAPQVFDVDNIPKHLTIEPIASHFACYLLTYINDAPNSASLLEDISNDENINLDLDCDGMFSIADTYIYHIFNEYAMKYKIYNYDFYGLKLTDKEDIPFDENIGLTAKQFDKCREFFFRYGWSDYYYCPFGDKGRKDAQTVKTPAFIDMNVLLNGCLNDRSVIPEYWDMSYYEKIVSGAPCFEEFVQKLNEYCKWFGIGEQEHNPWIFNDKEFETSLNYYSDAVEKGLAPLPDIDGDGYVSAENDMDRFEAKDLWCIHLYKDCIMNNGGEYLESYGKTYPFFTKETFNRLQTNFDLNNNGINGDMYDLEIAEFFIHALSDEDVERNPYSDIFDLADTGSERPERLLSVEKYNQLKGISTVSRSGDANCDSETGLADALLILQNNANSNKYQLTNSGEFNADVYNTGDGVTPMDALEIQKWDATKSIN